MKYLIIYEEVPESTTLYELDSKNVNADPTLWTEDGVKELIESCHGNIIGTDIEEVVETNINIIKEWCDHCGILLYDNDARKPIVLNEPYIVILTGELM